VCLIDKGHELKGLYYLKTSPLGSCFLVPSCQPQSFCMIVQVTESSQVEDDKETSSVRLSSQVEDNKETFCNIYVFL